jgi:type I restriction enzyme, R subunit
LRRIWSRPDTRKALLEGLSEKGFGAPQLAEIKAMINAESSDLFDVLAYIAFALAPITRRERAEASKGRISAHYDPKLQAFLDFVLAQYVSQGVEELGQQLEIRFRTRSGDDFGGRPGDPGYVRRVPEVFV